MKKNKHVSKSSAKSKSLKSISKKKLRTAEKKGLKIAKKTKVKKKSGFAKNKTVKKSKSNAVSKKKISVSIKISDSRKNFGAEKILVVSGSGLKNHDSEEKKHKTIVMPEPWSKVTPKKVNTGRRMDYF